jgi:Uma2 family endonuclease
MQPAPRLGIPEVKPAIESIRGRWVQKVSPKTAHSLLQGRLWGILQEWASSRRGYVGPEWRFYLLPLGEKPSSLVPDVAYVSRKRLPRESGKLPQKPTIAPDIAAEILSPDDSKRFLKEKIGLYLANGAKLVIVVDPNRRNVQFHEIDAPVALFEGSEIARPQTFPDLAIDLTTLFKDL